MERRPFGWSGKPVPAIGQGTWKLRDPRQAEAALRLGLDLGLTHVDTAEVYEGSEAVVGRVIAGRRDDVFLVSKVSPRNAHRRGTLEACRRSLERLGTDHLDVYLLHWWSEHPIEETMSAMAQLIDEGKIRMCGVSNLDVEQVELAQEALGGHRLVCNQVMYHPGRRDLEVDLLPHCRRHGIALVGYSTFGSGTFPGGRERFDRLAALAAEHGRTPHQVVLDALTRHPEVFLIPKAESAAHVRANAQALEPRLPPEAYEAFDELFPVPERVEGAPTLVWTGRDWAAEAPAAGATRQR